MNRTLLSVALALCLALPRVHALNHEALRRMFIRRSGCLESHNLTMEDVENYAVKGGYPEAEYYPDLKCFDACLYEKYGYMDDCEVHVESFADSEMFESVYKLLRKCKKWVKASERCECAYELTECIELDIPDSEEWGKE